MRISEDSVGEGIAAVKTQGCQGPEGILVAARRPLHEVRLHEGPRPFAERGSFDRVSEYGTGIRRIVQSITEFQAGQVFPD